MSTLHRLKAYFGMVPAEELDDYGHDYGHDYQASQDAGYGVDHDDEATDDVRGRSYASERAVPRRLRRAVPADYDRRARYGADDDGYVEPAVASIRAAQLPGWSPDTAPVCGALAVDTNAALPEPVREPVREPIPRSHPPFAEDGHLRPRIVTLHLRTYNEARTLGERYREGMPVIMDLTEMDDADAKRLVDFAAGLAFALRGSIDKVTTKVFLLSPPDVAVSTGDTRRIAEDGVSRQS